MKNLEMLEKSAKALSRKEMNCVKGGLKWTKDRSNNVEDRRGQYGSLYVQLEYLKSRTALDCLNGYVPGPFVLPTK